MDFSGNWDIQDWIRVSPDCQVFKMNQWSICALISLRSEGKALLGSMASPSSDYWFLEDTFVIDSSRHALTFKDSFPVDLEHQQASEPRSFSGSSEVASSKSIQSVLWCGLFSEKSHHSSSTPLSWLAVFFKDSFWPQPDHPSPFRRQLSLDSQFTLSFQGSPQALQILRRPTFHLLSFSPFLKNLGRTPQPKIDAYSLFLLFRNDCLIMFSLETRSAVNPFSESACSLSF